MLDDSKMQAYLLLAKGARGRALGDLISKATSDPALFGFSELLHCQQIQEISSGEFAAHFRLLELFAYGTWADYVGAPAGSLPELSPPQQNKLRQLTVMSLALQHKVLGYAALQEALGISSVRQLEDYIITECFYTNILHGKLDQKQACVQVHSVLGRDVRPEQVPVLVQGLNAWLEAGETLLQSIEQRIADAGSISTNMAARKAAQATEVEGVREVVKVELDNRNELTMDDVSAGLDYMEEDRLDRAPPGVFGGHWREGGERPERADRDRHRTGMRSKKRSQR